jgi:hypothetical protein
MSEIKKELTLIPKSEKYIQYMLEIIMKLPRTEKFSIGNEYKQSMYKMLENILMLSKVIDTEKINYINVIDAQLNVQRILLRIMYKNKWIDEKKFNYVIELIYELGKIIGGLLKYYGKNNKKSV